jgi:hypothetical protein
MIYNLIGSGILVAVGAAGMWAWMRLKVADARRQADHFAAWADRRTREWCAANATIARQTDLIGQLQDKRDRALACETPNAAHGLKKACKILRGELP